MKETLWKNTLNFKKYAPTIYANFITIVMILSEKKETGDITSVMTFDQVT
jgi:hypothetical protein